MEGEDCRSPLMIVWHSVVHGPFLVLVAPQYHRRYYCFFLLAVDILGIAVVASVQRENCSLVWVAECIAVVPMDGRSFVES